MEGAGETPQWFRALGAIAEDLGPVPSAPQTWCLTIACNLRSKGSEAAFWSFQAPGTLMAHMHTCRQTLTP